MHRLMKQIGEQFEVSRFPVKLKIVNPFTPMSNQDRISPQKKTRKSFQCQGKVTLNSSQRKIKFEGKNRNMRAILKDDELRKNTKIM